MHQFEGYVEQLRSLARQLAVQANCSDQALRAKVSAALNGGPVRALRKAVPLSQIRESGAFFTSAPMADRALAPLLKRDLGYDFCDPACGTGDLLLARARMLPLGRTLSATLSDWGNCLTGFDVHPEFVEAARYRLLILAMMRQGRKSWGRFDPDYEKLFPRIVRQDARHAAEAIGSVRLIAINPPYTLVTAPKDCEWASGRVNAAAVFMAECLVAARSGAYVGAILPEILRTGVRYQDWRRLIATLGQVKSLQQLGRFAPWADVDVFAMRIVAGKDESRRGPRWVPGAPQDPCGAIVSDYFDVLVGSVVPHRHPKRGPSTPYLTARALPRWGTVKRIHIRRRFSGRTVKGPFVLVRRTSSPDDKERAVATVVIGTRPVAVENHLIIFRPVDGSISQCRRLVRMLGTQGTREWLDARCRARHLSVAVIRNLPWSEVPR